MKVIAALSGTQKSVDIASRLNLDGVEMQKGVRSLLVAEELDPKTYSLALAFRGESGVLILHLGRFHPGFMSVMKGSFSSAERYASSLKGILVKREGSTLIHECRIAPSRQLFTKTDPLIEEYRLFLRLIEDR